MSDREIYCSRCTDKVFSAGLDAQAMGIKAALAAPKALKYNNQIHNRGTAPRIPADAMFITQPTSVQNQYQQKYKQHHEKHHFPAFVRINNNNNCILCIQLIVVFTCMQW